MVNVTLPETRSRKPSIKMAVGDDSAETVPPKRRKNDNASKGNKMQKTTIIVSGSTPSPGTGTVRDCASLSG